MKHFSKIILLLFCVSAFCQEIDPKNFKKLGKDSLEVIYKKHFHKLADSNKSRLLNNLCATNIYVDVIKANNYNIQSREISKKFKDKDSYYLT
ncbi:hypothetical protein, partial [Flavobacterium sp. 9AF]|uniref:hypothetical protein n=1 Tax=Flavobacterium sp. 9AF TaxID=2653142 RepID=UPI00135CF1BD